MAPLLLALMLSLGSPGPHDDLRLTIARVEAADAKPSDPEFTITLENQSDRDFVVVLGYMIANGKQMVPSATTLVLTDEAGRTIKLQYREQRVGGRIDDYVVPLRSHSSYLLRVSIAEYRRPDLREFDWRWPAGTYTVQASFEGGLARFSGPDMAGVRVMRLWTGAVSSNVLRFSIP